MPVSRVRYLCLVLCLLWPMSPAFGYQIDDRFSVDGELFVHWTQTETDADGGFRTGRAHLGASAVLDSWKLRVLIELDPDGTGKRNDSARLREGYVHLDMGNGSGLRFGVQPTAMVAVDEARLWGLRQVAPSFSEFWGLTPAADSGLSLLGSGNDGFMDYQLTVSNGEGYDHPVDGNGNALSARIGLHDGPWEVGAFIYSEQDHPTTGPSPAPHKDPKRTIYYLGYGGPVLQFSGQYLTGDDGANAETFNNFTGGNVQGRLKMETFTLFARWDRITPKEGEASQSLTLYGLAFTLSPNVQLSGHYQLLDMGPYDEATVAITTRVVL